MKKDKKYYQSLYFYGFTWRGFWSGFHHFVKPEKPGYSHIKCTERDIETGNIAEMARNGWSK